MNLLATLFLALCATSALAFEFSFTVGDLTTRQPVGLINVGSEYTNIVNLTLSWPAESTGFTFYLDIVTLFANGSIDTYLWRNEFKENEAPAPQSGLTKYITFSPCSNVSNTADTFFAASVVPTNYTQFKGLNCSATLIIDPTYVNQTSNVTNTRQVVAAGIPAYLLVTVPTVNISALPNDTTLTNTTLFRAHVLLTAVGNSTLPLASVCSNGNNTCPDDGTCNNLEAKVGSATIDFVDWQQGTQHWIMLAALNSPDQYENPQYNVLIYFTPESDSTDAGWSKTKIAMVAGGAIIAVAVVGLIIYFVARRSRSDYEQVV